MLKTFRIWFVYFLKNTKLFMRVSQHAGIFVLFLLVWFGIFLFVCFSGKKWKRVRQLRDCF